MAQSNSGIGNVIPNTELAQMAIPMRAAVCSARPRTSAADALADELRSADQRILGDPQHQPASAVTSSAATGARFERLLEKIDQVLALDPVSAAVSRFSVSDLAPLNLLRENAQVTSTRYDEKGCDVEAVVPESIKRRLKPYLASALLKAGPDE